MELSTKKTRSGKLFKDIDCFVNSCGDPIFCKYWMPQAEPKALILLVHGFAEHCARYDSFAKKLNELGLLVFSHDHANHGENPGYFLDIVDYKQYTKDLLQHVDIMKTKYPDLPVYVFGHSMGGCLSVFLGYEAGELFSGIILSSPMLAPNSGFTKLKVLMASALYTYFPKLPVGKLDPSQISRDECQVQTYLEDPLVYNGPVRLRTGYLLYQMTVDVQKCFSDFNVPFLVLHGDGDEICDISGSRQIMCESISSDKKMVVFEGAKHELLHEIGTVPCDFIREVKEWLASHMECC